MGSGISSNFVYNETISGKTNKDLSIGLELGYNRKDIAKLYAYFRRLDVNKSGIITSQDITESLNLVNMEFSDVVVKIFDVSGNNRISFIDFIVAIWNILTIEESHLGTLTFNLLDVLGKGKLLLHEITHIIDKMLDFPRGTKSLVKDLFIRLGDVDGAITVESFNQAAEEFPFLLNAVYCMCAKLKIKSLAKDRSLELLKYRESTFGSQSLLDIISKMKHRPSNYEQLAEDYKTNLDTIISEISNGSERISIKPSIPSVLTTKISIKIEQKTFESNLTASSSSGKCVVLDTKRICDALRLGSALTSRNRSSSSSLSAIVEFNIKDVKDDKALEDLKKWSTNENIPTKIIRKKTSEANSAYLRTASEALVHKKKIANSKAINAIEDNFWMPSDHRIRNSSRSASFRSNK